MDIDQRAAQLAGFALLMKARADDHRILSAGSSVQMNVMAIQGTEHLAPDEMLSSFSNSDLADHAKPLIHLFKDAKTFGSLISIPPELASVLPNLQIQLEKIDAQGVLEFHHAIETLKPLVQQAIMLAKKYDCVIANPPYMGGKGMNADLKKYLKDQFKGYEKDLFSAFIIKNLKMTKPSGQLGFMSPFVWMFISSYEDLRCKLFNDASITTLVQLEYSGFAEATVPICTFTLSHDCIKSLQGDFIKLSDFKGHQNQAPKTLEAIQNPDCGYRFTASSDDFKKIPGSPLAYWVSDRVKEIFYDHQPLGSMVEAKVGLQTSDNDRFLRLFWEVDTLRIGFKYRSREEAQESGKKWFPCDKGGGFRKWYGNNEFVVNWENDGEEIKNFKNENGKLLSRPQNVEHYFKEGITWGKITSSNFSTRATENGFIFTDAGMKILCENRQQILNLSGLLNSKLTFCFLSAISQTLNFEQGHISRIPVIQNIIEKNIIQPIIDKAAQDWDSFETSWDFQTFPLLQPEIKNQKLEQSFLNWQKQSQNNITETKRLEEENNRLFIEAYGLEEELTPEVPLEQITLTVNPKYRYGGDLTAEAGWNRFREDTAKELISYAIGCMMGRYNLDQPGLITAHPGKAGFDPDPAKIFTDSEDGIIPITEMDWGFRDDATTRFGEFLGKAWPPETLPDNLKFIADNLSSKTGESSQDTIRRYLSLNFFKDHLKTYKKRPIYWLFSSGKNKAFECLVYLHRYQQGTLSKMRTKYVIPLQGKFLARESYLTEEIEKAHSSSAQKTFQKELDALIKKKSELGAFDDLLRHHADQRIAFDLDDGVKVNYAKFGNLLADVKTVTGKT